MNPPNNASTQEARTLIESVAGTLAEQDQRLREMGLNPSKVRAVDQFLTASQQRQAEAAAQDDLAAVDQEVAEAKAQQSAAGGGSRRVSTKHGFI